MGTGVSAPEALVLICAINDLFCYDRIGWRRGCVSGMSGVCLWREFTFQRSKSATQLDEITTDCIDTCRFKKTGSCLLDEKRYVTNGFQHNNSSIHAERMYTWCLDSPGLGQLKKRWWELKAKISVGAWYTLPDYDFTTTEISRVLFVSNRWIRKRERPCKRKIQKKWTCSINPTSDRQVFSLTATPGLFQFQIITEIFTSYVYCALLSLLYSVSGN